MTKTARTGVITAPEERESVRPVAREVARHVNGRTEVVGRNGEVLTRKAPGSTDPFAFEPHEIPEGYDYQWIRVATINQPDPMNERQYMQNGWRPVPADRHSDRYIANDKGHIVHGNQMLVERPMVLSDEARREERMKADRQLNDQFSQYGHKLEGGFSANTPNARQATFINRSTERGMPSAPLPIDG